MYESCCVLSGFTIPMSSFTGMGTSSQFRVALSRLLIIRLLQLPPTCSVFCRQAPRRDQHRTATEALLPGLWAPPRPKSGPDRALLSAQTAVR